MPAVMAIVRKTTALSIVLSAAVILGYQNSYDVIQENFLSEYYDSSLVHFHCGVYKSNRTTNAINLTFTLKINLKENDMAYVTGFKWLSNEYRLDIIQFHNTIKDIIEIKYFDINRLLHNYTTPALIWPVKKGVTYRMRNWIPDSGQFPPGIPEGKWKLLLNFTLANKTPIVTLSWLFKIQYKVKFFEWGSKPVH